MMYKINVAERYGRNWNDTGDAYKFLFRVTDDCPFRAKVVAKRLQEQYPAPEYNVTYSVAKTTYQEVDLELSLIHI